MTYLVSTYDFILLGQGVTTNLYYNTTQALILLILSMQDQMELIPD